MKVLKHFPGKQEHSLVWTHADALAILRKAKLDTHIQCTHARTNTSVWPLFWPLLFMLT